jgi:hypothetical protein
MVEHIFMTGNGQGRYQGIALAKPKVVPFALEGAARPQRNRWSETLTVLLGTERPIL